MGTPSRYLFPNHRVSQPDATRHRFPYLQELTDRRFGAYDKVQDDPTARRIPFFRQTSLAPLAFEVATAFGSGWINTAPSARFALLAPFPGRFVDGKHGMGQTASRTFSTLSLNVIGHNDLAFCPDSKPKV